MSRDTNDLMLELLAEVVHDRQPVQIAAEEWPDVLKELYAQTVSALIGDYYSVLGLSMQDETNLLLTIARNRQTFHRLMKEQDYVLSILDNADVPAVVIKGAAAAVNYSHPENRCMGDIDLLVQPQDFENAYDALVAAGFKPEQTPDDFTRHIVFFTENGIEVELHYNFSSSDNSAQNQFLDDILYRAISSRVFEDCSGHCVPMLPPMENGIILLGHINQHLSTGLGLRQIIDWMLFVEKYVDDEFWNGGFADLADIIGMKRLAIITTAMCQKYLGLGGDIHWAAYEPVCDELMEYILSRGNFGRKQDPTNQMVTTVLKHFRNPLRGLAVMQRNGLINWKATQKHPCLRPFAWCYQLGRWITKGFKQGVNINILDDATSSAKEIADLIDKLGVTRL